MNKEFKNWSGMIIANRKETWDKHQKEEFDNIWAEFKKTSDFIIQSSQRRRERLAREAADDND